MSTICVYCSSSRSVDETYFELARTLGRTLAERGHTLVFGGTDIGVMGALARAVRGSGGRVVGVVPEIVRGSPYVFEGDETIFTPDLRGRKAIMEQRADAFIALPGGFGTLEEVLEVLALKQLTFHRKPIILLDHQAFFAPLIELFEHLYRQRFASAEHHRPMYGRVATVDDVFDYLASYQPVEVPLAWS